MDCKIEAKEAFGVIGSVREFSSDTSYAEIPQFWAEHFQSGDGQFIFGMFGVCRMHSSDGKMFDYMIADSVAGKGKLPDRFVEKEIPAKTWAVFPIKGAMPNALQQANKKIWNEWLPNCREYELDGNLSVEMYSSGDTSSASYYSEIWIPVKKK